MVEANLREIRALLLQRGEDLFRAPAEFVHFTGQKGADVLLDDIENHPHAFVLGCVMDRQIKAERAWLIPYLFSTKLGEFSFQRLRSLSLSDVLNLMRVPRPLHRLPEELSSNFHEAVRMISNDYAGDARNIWRNRPASGEVVLRFLRFRGAGPKIATMGTNILARRFKVPLSDYQSIDISADVHVRRVFERLGLVGDDAGVDEVIYRARTLNPEFPGLVDFPCWEIGRKWCRPTMPLCGDCYMHTVCPVGQETCPGTASSQQL